MLPPSAIPSTSAILTPIFACRCATDSLPDVVRPQPSIGMGIGTEAMLPEGRELWRSCATVADLHDVVESSRARVTTSRGLGRDRRAQNAGSELGICLATRLLRITQLVTKGVTR